MACPEIPSILLVRLRPRLPNGNWVGERERVVHLVPMPQSREVPEALLAYCGQVILPGTAELLDGLSGMPCNRCLARSRIPTFAILRTLPTATDAAVDGARLHSGAGSFLYFSTRSSSCVGILLTNGYGGDGLHSRGPVNCADSSVKRRLSLASSLRLAEP